MPSCAIRPLVTLVLLLSACTPPEDEQPIATGDTLVATDEVCDGVDNDGDGQVDEWVGGYVTQFRHQELVDGPGPVPVERVLVQDPSVALGELWMGKSSPDAVVTTIVGTGAVTGQVVDELIVAEYSVANQSRTFVDGRLAEQSWYGGNASESRRELVRDEEGRLVQERDDRWWKVGAYDRDVTYEQVDGRLVAHETALDSDGDPMWLTRWDFDAQDRVAELTRMSTEGDVEIVYTNSYDAHGLLEGFTWVDHREEGGEGSFGYDWTVDAQGRPLVATASDRSRQWTWTYDTYGRITGYTDSGSFPSVSSFKGEWTYGADGYLVAYREETGPSGDTGGFVESWSGTWSDAEGGVRGTLAIDITDVGAGEWQVLHVSTCEPVR